MAEFSKRYDPKLVEPKWYRHWMENGDFVADANSSKPAFSIVMPPPNITGALHLNGTPLQEHRRADAPNAPRLRRVAGYVGLQDSDAKEFGHERAADLKDRLGVFEAEAYSYNPASAIGACQDCRRHLTPGSC